MNLNFHKYREKVRNALLRYKGAADSAEDPFLTAWLAYGLSADGLEDNLLLLQARDVLFRWSQGTEVSRFQRNLGPRALLAYLLGRLGEAEQARGIADTVMTDVAALVTDNRFSPLRDPEQVFLIALGLGQQSELANRGSVATFISALQSQAKGPLKRRVLFAAALRELGQEGDLEISMGAADAGDIVAAVWWSERYDLSRRASFWQAFDRFKSTFALSAGDELESGAHRILSVAELSMLYEAVACETKNPDPALLFEIYPLHPRIRGVAEASFRKGEYRDAVENAAKALNQLLRQATKSQLSETQLIREALGDPCKPNAESSPKIRFNPLDPNAPDYKSQVNEQRGLSHLGYAVFFAFRHPKAHEPKDHPYWGSIKAEQALDELVIISYLTHRIERAPK